VIQDLKKLLAEAGPLDPRCTLLEFPIQSLEDLTASLAMADFVVATRFHGILLSILMHKPVLALSNHHKMSDLMIDVGQSQYLLDIDTFTCESLIGRFTLLEFNREGVTREIARRVFEYRRELDRQYGLLLTRAAVGRAQADLALKETR
jgi:polysaccharide pyruvyl transferase WcaK-like protein